MQQAETFSRLQTQNDDLKQQLADFDDVSLFDWCETQYGILSRPIRPPPPAQVRWA